MIGKKFRFLTVFVIVVSLSASIAKPAQAIDEVKIGKDYHRQLSREYKVYEDPRVTRIGREVSRVSGIKGVEFYAIDMGKEDQPNAFQIPYHIYTTKSLLKQFDDISLTFILAHEMGHQNFSHLVKQMKKNQSVGIGAAILGAILGVDSSSVGGYAIRIAGGSIINNYSREHEEEADMFGLCVLWDLGIPFEKAAKSFEKLGGGKSENSTLNYLFGSHPMIRERIKRASSAESWLKPRAVDLFTDSNRTVAVAWPYTGDKPMKSDTSRIREGLMEKLGVEGWKFSTPDASLRNWTSLMRLENLSSPDFQNTASEIGADRMLAILKMDKQSLKGVFYDVSKPGRIHVDWKFKDGAELAEKVIDYADKRASEFKTY